MGKRRTPFVVSDGGSLCRFSSGWNIADPAEPPKGIPGLLTPRRSGDFLTIFAIPYSRFSKQQTPAPVSPLLPVPLMGSSKNFPWTGIPDSDLPKDR